MIQGILGLLKQGHLFRTIGFILYSIYPGIITGSLV